LENYIQADDYEMWMITENGPYIPMKTAEDGMISKGWRKMLGPRSCCTLALDQTSTLVSQSVILQRRYGIPFA